MQIGVHLPQIGPRATRESIRSFAQAAEELGFDSLWVSDHIVIPRHIRSHYVADPSGRFPVPPNVPFLEAISTLLFAAGCTERIMLGTSVCVVPWRNPVVTAKVLSTLDVLSGGRLIFGAGAGWMEEQFEMLGKPFRQRGAMTDEWLEVVRRLWTEENPRFHGRFFQFEDLGFAPKPLQRPYPPLWVGGDSEPALRRAGRFADAWHASPLMTAEDLAQPFEKARRFAQEAARDPQALQLTLRTRLDLAQGTRDAISRLRAFREAGVSHVVLEVPQLFGASPEQAQEMLGRLAREVRPEVESTD